MDNTSIRQVHTDIYSNKAFDIFTAIHKYFRNNWSVQMSRIFAAFEIKQNPNGEIVLEFDKSHWRYGRSGFSTKSDADIKAWLALNVKLATRKSITHTHSNELRNQLGREAYYSIPIEELNKKYNALWNRDSDIKVKIFSTENTDALTRDIYCIYEKLFNRKNFNKNWPKKYVDELIGIERDAIATELEAARREELAKLEAEFIADKNSIYNWLVEAKNAAYKALSAEYDQKIQDRTKQYNQALEDLNNSLSFTIQEENLPSFLA